MPSETHEEDAAPGQHQLRWRSAGTSSALVAGGQAGEGGAHPALEPARALARPRGSASRRIGASVSASSSEMSTATEIVTPNWKKNLPMMPFMKATGRKMATIASGRRGGGEGDLARAHRGGRHLALAVLAVAVDVLEHHDRVVDDDADRQREPEQGEGVEGEAEEVHDDEGAEDRGRDRQQHVEGRGPRAEEEPAHEAGRAAPPGPA